MAKVKFTAIVADMRNKLNGSVFSKNRGGSYVRTKVTPVNRQTSFQAAVRNRLATFSAQFRGLGATDIAAWNAAVDNFKKTDIFGDVRNPSGVNLYVKLNSNLARIAVTALSSPPLPDSVAAVTGISATAAAGTPALSIISLPGTIPADMKAVFSATKPKSAGQSFFGGQYTDMGVVDAAGSGTFNALSAWNAKYGALVAGQKIGVRVQYINKVTGQAGIPITATVVVAA